MNVNIYKTYDQYKFIDYNSNEPYSINMIINSLIETNLGNDFLIIPIFDALIGNSDRHHSNWGIVKNKITDSIRISPLYDNGSSLCCLIDEGKVDSFLRDKMKFESLIYGKSKSMIRWNDKKRIRHFELIEYIKNDYYMETIDFFMSMKEKLTDEKIEELINLYPDEIIAPKIKILLGTIKKITSPFASLFSIMLRRQIDLIGPL